MATKSSTKTTKTKTSKKTTQKHDLLYIMSNSCGWCKKANPVVDELVKEGHKITTLDVMNPDEANRAQEVKTKHNAQCGTPLFLDAETGNMVCGFREKDVLEKWAKGEEIPKPPQPKTPPPPPPQNFDDENEINTWKNAYEKWTKENDHLPKILPADEVVVRLKQAAEQRAAQGQQPMQPNAAPGAAPIGSPSHPSVTKNTRFYYVVEDDGTKSAVMSDPAFILQLRHQYYSRESTGELTKVIGDSNWQIPPGSTHDTNGLPGRMDMNAIAAKAAQGGGLKAGHAGSQGPGGIGSKGIGVNKTGTAPAKNLPKQDKKVVEKAVKEQIAKAQKQASDKKSKTTKKSKENKKTIESF